DYVISQDAVSVQKRIGLRRRVCLLSAQLAIRQPHWAQWKKTRLGTSTSLFIRRDSSVVVPPKGSCDASHETPERLTLPAQSNTKKAKLEIEPTEGYSYRRVGAEWYIFEAWD